MGISREGDEWQRKLATVTVLGETAAAQLDSVAAGLALIHSELPPHMPTAEEQTAKDAAHNAAQFVYDMATRDHEQAVESERAAHFALKDAAVRARYLAEVGGSSAIASARLIYERAYNTHKKAADELGAAARKMHIKKALLVLGDRERADTRIIKPSIDLP
jgi:hypothetical protein